MQSLIVALVTQVRLWEQTASHPWQVWKLIPVQVDDPPTGLDDQKEEALPKYPSKQCNGGSEG